MATVVIAPDGFGGTLTAAEAAEAIAAGWREARPDDESVQIPMSDGGEGLLDVLARPGDTWHTTEVAGPLGHPVEAAMLERPDGSVVVESAQACGLALVPVEQRRPSLTTTYGVGQLLEAARALGPSRILVGLGGSATVDGGAGALMALGFRPTLSDGSGLKVGGGDLGRVDAITVGWSADWSGVEVELLSDVTTPLPEAAQVFGPQKGASPEEVAHLAAGLDRWADVVERDLATGPGSPELEEVDGIGAKSDRPRLREIPGTGAAGGLGYALAAAIGARFVIGSEAVGNLVGLPDAIAGADGVVTGEGRLDETTGTGKVVDHVSQLARQRGVLAMAVVGQHAGGGDQLDDVEASAPDGRIVDAAAEVTAAAGRLADRFRHEAAKR